MKVVEKDGDIFESGADVLVNPCNCVGIAGAGLSKEFKQKYTSNFFAYKRACSEGKVKIGRVYPHECVGALYAKYIINFPTKDHWRDPSQYIYIEVGMAALINWINQHDDIDSIAIPALGCGLGGLEWPEIKKIIHFYLRDIARDIIVYVYEQ